MYIVVLGVRWTNDLTFFKIFPEEKQEEANKLKNYILNRYPGQVTEDDVEITPMKLEVGASQKIHLRGA